MGSLTLGALARAAGVNPETIRYYERRGLLPEPPRTPAGYRQYGTEDADRVALILRAKDLGFTLAEIGELLDGGGTAAEVLAAARHRLAGLDEQAVQLERRRARLRLLLRACEAGEDGCISLDIDQPLAKVTEP
ncbi:MAG TPA: MerR family transcriptional regulator [Acidimicrobiales bacterium]|jgi:MerR family mercuric resistance operon transcriptional regulator